MAKYQSNELTYDTTQLQGKRILFACVPADGHFNPLVPLATHLQQLGCDVRWYTSERFAPKLEKLGIPLYPLNKALDLGGKPPEELFPDRVNHKGRVKKLVFDLTNGFILRAPEYFEDVREIHRQFPFDVVVADCMLFAIPFIKHILNVPVISIGVVPLTESSKDIAPPGLGMTPPSNFFQKVKADILRRVISRIFRKPSAVMRSILHQYRIQMTTANLFDYVTRESTLLLQLGTPGFEYKRRDLGSNIRFIGASLPRSGNAKWDHRKLLLYKKVILVTQGTVETDVTKLIIPTLEAFKNTEHLVIVTTGSTNTEKLRREYAYDNIIIENFIPFDAVMPLADVYVTNGGYGGVTFSIENKLPMVVAGVHEGKSEINARVGYFKIGINLNTERPTSRQIKESVEKVLADGTYRKNIEILSWEFSNYKAEELCAQYIIGVIRQNGYLGTHAAKQSRISY